MSYIKDLLEQDYGEKVSLPTIINRTKNRKRSINNLELKISNAPIHEKIQLRIILEKESDLCKIRFCYKDKFIVFHHSIAIATSEHIRTQLPHLMQPSSLHTLMTLNPPVLMLSEGHRQSLGQNSTHIQQPLHLFSSILIICIPIILSSFIIGIAFPAHILFPMPLCLQ